MKSFIAHVAILSVFILVETEGFMYSSRWNKHGNPCELTLGLVRSKSSRYNHIRTVPSTCEAGHVNWHYPKGLVHLDFSDTSSSATPFSICLSQLGGSIHKVTDITTGFGIQYKLSDEGEVCVASHGTRLRLELDGGPRITYYLVRIGFTRVRHQQLPLQEHDQPEQKPMRY